MKQLRKSKGDSKDNYGEAKSKSFEVETTAFRLRRSSNWNRSLHEAAARAQKSLPRGERVLGPWTEPSILCVSKQIRRETSPIYYKHNEFTQKVRFEVFDTGKRVHGEPGGRFKAAVRKLASIVKICGVHPFSKFRFQFTGEVTRYIAHVLPLLELMRSGFEPEDEIDETAAEQTYASIFIPLPPTFGNSNVLASFERAVRLGQRAREQEWEEEKLKERFQTMLSSMSPDLYPRDLW
ncbi:hypothetical protein LTS10_007292 [Elasticomyces elasticus]|nr:hypothetical protein LTS10_007292 [Elasticomyces elasticus]